MIKANEIKNSIRTWGRKSKSMFASKRGETLIETIISFAIVIAALGALTVLIVSANNMNTGAKENSDSVEAAGTVVEKSIGAADGEDVEVLGDGNMTISISGQQINIPVTVKSVEPYTFFEINSEDAQ